MRRHGRPLRRVRVPVAVNEIPDPAVDLGYGLAVFALPALGRMPAPGWQDRCLADPAAVAACWRAGDNVGVGCRASNVVVLDLDHHRDQAVDGVARLAAVCEQLGEEWPVTLTVATPSGGRHLYFRAPPHRVVLSASGARSPLGPGVDVRAPGRRLGGYVLGPDSRTPAGRYTVAVDVPVAPMPPWLVEVLAVPARA